MGKMPKYKKKLPSDTMKFKEWNINNGSDLKFKTSIKSRFSIVKNQGKRKLNSVVESTKMVNRIQFKLLQHYHPTFYHSKEQHNFT